MLNEAVNYPPLYTSRAVQRRAQCRPNFQTGVADFRIRPRRSATETRPAHSRKIGGGARRARIQSSASSLRGCQPEREQNASRLAYPVRRCRTRGTRRGSTEVYATFPLGGAQGAGQCALSVCPHRLQDSVGHVAERTWAVARHVLMLTWHGMGARHRRKKSNLVPSRYISI